MKSIKSVGYTIYIGNQIFDQLTHFISAQHYSKYIILCDENTLTHCLPLLLQHTQQFEEAEVIEIEPGEQSKSIEIATHIWQTLLDVKADKQTLLINLGGGVVSDLGGFVASTYKRGIDYINIPTSLLAMADASVGGKTGIDFGSIKNSIGTISQPKAVFIYPDFLQTLANNHLKNGLAEVYKIALTCSAPFWKTLSAPKAAISLEQLITKSVSLKNSIVKKDPTEKNIRKALNFGHTAGHAIEATLLGTKSTLLHGEAIIIGIIMESWLSYQKKLMTKSELTEIVSVLIARFKPKAIDKKHIASIIELTLQDKKNKNQQIQAALLKGIGHYQLDVAVSITHIEKAFDFYNVQVKQ